MGRGWGEYLLLPLNRRGYDFAQVIEHMAYGTEGIYGIPTYESSTFIFLFILFGAFLEKAGMIKRFTDVSLGLVGHRMGAAAKVSVLSSGLMGTISGSGAGMAPGEDAVLQDGWWVWQPGTVVPDRHLAASGATGAGWRLCDGPTCHEIGRDAGAAIRIAPCPPPDQ